MTAPSDAAPVELDRRLGRALGTHDVHPEVRAQIQNAWFPGANWDDLPANVQQLVEQVEAMPVQAWEDPADVPDDIDNLG